MYTNYIWLYVIIYINSSVFFRIGIRHEAMGIQLTSKRDPGFLPRKKESLEILDLVVNNG